MKKVMFLILALLSMLGSINASEEVIVHDESAYVESLLLASESVKEYVAKNKDVFYEDIDAAILDAKDNDTIELLANVSPSKTFYKSLTFTGKYTMTYNVYGWKYSGNLTIDGATLVLNSLEGQSIANNSEAYDWFTMVLNGELTVKNSGKIEFNFDSNYGVKCAIYMSGSGYAKINVLDNSKFYINGRNTKGVVGQGIQLGSTANTGIYVKINQNLLLMELIEVM